jgi:hypothetical protein
MRMSFAQFVSEKINSARNKRYSDWLECYIGILFMGDRFHYLDTMKSLESPQIAWIKQVHRRKTAKPKIHVCWTPSSAPILDPKSLNSDEPSSSSTKSAARPSKLPQSSKVKNIGPTSAHENATSVASPVANTGYGVSSSDSLVTPLAPPPALPPQTLRALAKLFASLIFSWSLYVELKSLIELDKLRPCHPVMMRLLNLFFGHLNDS